MRSTSKRKIRTKWNNNVYNPFGRKQSEYAEHWDRCLIVYLSIFSLEDQYGDAHNNIYSFN